MRLATALRTGCGTMLLALATSALLAGDDGWISLFDGHSLQGWKANENPDTFHVVDGLITFDGPRSHLFYLGEGEPADFRNFEFYADVLVRPGANSGIFFHAKMNDSGSPKQGIEVQVDNTYQPKKGRELKLAGCLYNVRGLYKSIVRDNEWYTVHLTVRGKRVQVELNGTLVIDYVEPEGLSDEDLLPGKRIGHGTFALQGHDPDSKASFRNLRVRRLPDEPPAEPVKADAIDAALARLQRGTVPVLDLHSHLKGGLTIDELLAYSRKTGIQYGVAANCGLKFPITDDAGIEAYVKSLAGKPVFIGMQAEGREWPTLFSPQAIARFDYVFSDAMTIVDHRGQRARLWIPAEVDIPDAEAFMERLVQTIEGILDHEPVDIYANPTYLPDVIAKDYDKLWTAARKQRVIDALARNGVALEISNRYHLPKPDMILAAKKAGIQFTFGTNNTDRNLGRLEYALEMVEKCKLTGADMWMPKPDGQKPIQKRKK